MKESGSGNEIEINNVLFATDFSPAAENAFSYALAIAEGFGSKVYIAHVIDTDSFELLDDDSIRTLIERTRSEAVRKITEFLELHGLPPDRYQIVVAEGVVFEALVDLIDRHHIDIAVLGTHGRRAFKKLIMGSIAEEVFRMAPCPVLTVGSKVAPAGRGGPQHILYAFQFAPDSSNAARYAVSLAERYDATLTVMHVTDDVPPSEGAARWTSEQFEHWVGDHVAQDSSLRNRLRFEPGFGPAADLILDFAGRGTVDLIVMHVRQFDPIIAAHLPKSDTAYELTSRASRPVLTVRS
jgi:nucleotide-binding universal stress UspA family protein